MKENENQGKRKSQIEDSEAFSFIAFSVILFVIFILKLLNA